VKRALKNKLNDGTMKKGILFLLLAGSFSAKAQSLKEMLYSGKLKADSNAVVRRTDDYKSMVDTGTKKPDTSAKVQAVAGKPVITAVPGDSSVVLRNPKVDSVAAAVNKQAAVTPNTATPNKETGIATDAGVKNPVTDAGVAAGVTAGAVTETKAPVKSNNKIWKEYTDSLVGSMKSDVLSSKKVKKETYYLLVEYELDTTGQVGINNVTVSPENAFLQASVKERIESSPPQLAPYVDSNNQVKKVKRKYNFMITKE